MSNSELTRDDLSAIIEKGISNGLWRFLGPFAVVMLIVMAVHLFTWWFELGKDSTDPVDGRSGMELRTDAMTGCQYLESKDGYLTPRMSRNGKQVCK